MSDQPQPLLDVREDERFQAAQRDVQAALVNARRFAQSPTFKDRSEANAASDCIQELKDVEKAAEASRKEIKAPYKATNDHIDGHCRELLDPLRTAITVLTKKGVAFKQAERRQQEEERKAEEERLAKEAEAKADAAQKAAEAAEAKPQSAEAQKKAAEAHQQAAAAAVATPTEKVHPKQLRGDMSSFGTSTSYKWDVVDLEQLPPEHHTFNKKTIDAAVKGEKAMAKAQGRPFNLQLLPGVRIWPEEHGVSRRARG